MAKDCLHTICARCNGITVSGLGSIIDVCSPKCPNATGERCECKCRAEFHKGNNKPKLNAYLQKEQKAKQAAAKAKKEAKEARSAKRTAKAMEQGAKAAKNALKGRIKQKNRLLEYKPTESRQMALFGTKKKAKRK